MNAMQQARAAYRTAEHPIRTPRSTEYEVFARITARLKAAARPAARFHDLATAIHDNRSLWAALAADVAGEGNALPRPLRARILYLAEFTRQHSTRVLRAGATAEPLIAINTAVMRGLGDRISPS